MAFGLALERSIPPALEVIVAGPEGDLAYPLVHWRRWASPRAIDGDGVGTELIVRNDLFHGQACPTDPPSKEYTYLLPLLGLDYWVCHPVRQRVLTGR